MNRTLVRDIYKIQLLSTFFYAFLAFTLTAALVWSQTMEVHKETLSILATLVKNEVIENPELFTTKVPNRVAIQHLIDPGLNQTIAAYQTNEINIGFYSRAVDEVILRVSTNKSIPTFGGVLPLSDPSRTVWQTRKPIFSLQYATIYHRWILKCAQPVIVNDQVIGHSFANITLSHLIQHFTGTFLALLLTFLVVALITAVASDRIKDRIQKNIAQLAIGDYYPSKPHFDYTEFAAVADLNHQTLADLKATEQQLQESHQALNHSLENITEIIEGITDGFFAIDHEWHLLYANKACENFRFGKKRTELIGKNIWEVYPEYNNSIYSKLYQKVMNTQIPEICETHYQELDTWFEVRVYPAKDGILVFLSDITARKKMELELLKTEKLESLGILAAGIAHDFNNSLAAILGNIQLAKIMIANGKPVDKHLDQAANATQKASDLTKQLLTFTKGGTPQKSITSLANLLEDTVQFNLSGSMVNGVFTIPETLWHVEVDACQISQVISNIVVNAKQAMPHGGQLAVSAENISGDKLSARKPGIYVKISIKDQGMGIPPEIAQRIFDPFFTTKKDGNGLGLTASYSIMKQHGGWIEVSSIPDKESTFTLYLPASDLDLADPEVAAAAPDPVRGGRILFMDDEPMIREAISEALHSMGFQVDLAEDGTAALTLYRQAYEVGSPFDVVILDLTIRGGMDGVETVTQLRQFDPDVKAIISSGYVNAPVISEYEKFGFKGVVSKPYK